MVKVLESRDVIEGHKKINPRTWKRVVTALAKRTQSSLSVEPPKQVATSGRKAVTTEQIRLIRYGSNHAEEASWYSARGEDGASRP